MLAVLTFHLESAKRDIETAICIGAGALDESLVDNAHAAVLVDELLISARDSFRAAKVELDRIAPNYCEAAAVYDRLTQGLSNIVYSDEAQALEVVQ